MMKDNNINNKSTDQDTTNENKIELRNAEDSNKGDVNKNETLVKSASSEMLTTMDNDDVKCKKNVTMTYENPKEVDEVINMEQETSLHHEEDIEATETLPDESKTTSTRLIPKHMYAEDQWSPLNQDGKKTYGIGLLKQIKDDPMSKNRPAIPLLESCNIIRTSPMPETVHVPVVARPINDSLFPMFAKGSATGSKYSWETKKDSRSNTVPGRGRGMKQVTSSGSSSSKSVIHVRLHDDVKLNEVDSAWKPARFRQENTDEEELKTQELYKTFRGILNKLTPQKFDTLLDKIKSLEINNQKRLEGVIDLIFEKAIDEPNFSEAYAAMCNRLSQLKVPADNVSNTDQCVNFRTLIINKCQKQFEAENVDTHIVEIEKAIADCTDPLKKKELQLTLEDEQRKTRMRSIGNIRFIGELYKLKMLTSKIMVYCIKRLIDKLEEERLECLCKLLTTIGEQIENEVSGQLDNIFKSIQAIVDEKSNKISSRVRFMIQDVIELRKRKWVKKGVIDSQPKTMDQIQKEAEQQQRYIELMNAAPSGSFRRDDGGRGKRGDSGRHSSNNSSSENAWKPSRIPNYPVDTSKLKAVTQKNLSTIKLAPHNSAWTHGSGTKNTAPNAGSSNSMIIISKNKYSPLENVQADPTILRGKQAPSIHSKGASIERSTFKSRSDISSDGGRLGTGTVPHSNITESTKTALPKPTPTTEAQVALQENVIAELLPQEKDCIKGAIKKFMVNFDIEEFVADIVKQGFQVHHHAAVVKELSNITLDISPTKFDMVAKSLENLISTLVISSENFLAGLQETLEFSPELFIDIPMLYKNLGNLLAPHIAKNYITLVDIHKLSGNIVSSNQGHLLLNEIFKNINDKEGTNVVKKRWLESGMQLKQWMEEEQIPKWMSDNNLEYLEEESKLEVKLLELMKAGEDQDHIKGWIKENVGKSSNEDWFIRSLTQAICEYALISQDGQEMFHFNPDRMNKYANLIHEFGETKQSREINCLFGIQQLIRKREHPQGLALVIFQYLYEQDIISSEGFIEWEKSEKEPEGKAVMLKMLTSFFTNIKEVENDDSSGEE